MTSYQYWLFSRQISNRPVLSASQEWYHQITTYPCPLAMSRGSEWELSLVDVGKPEEFCLLFFQ